MVLIAYKEELENTAEIISSNDNGKKAANTYIKKRKYFCTPTEIFSRCLELFLIKSKNMVSSFLPSHEL